MPASSSSRPLDPAMAAALRAAKALSHEWKQNWLGVEHLFTAVLQAEQGAGPATDCLRALVPDLGELLEQVRKPGNATPPREVPEKVPLTPQCTVVLDRAERIMRKQKRQAVDSRDFVEAVIHEGASVPAWAIACCLRPESEGWPGISAEILPAVRALRDYAGEAWRVDSASAAEAIRVLGGDPGLWDARAGLHQQSVKAWFRQTDIAAFARHGKCVIRSTEKPLWRWRRTRPERRALRIAAMEALPGACAISCAAFLAALPDTLEKQAGRLNHAWFLARKPAGKLRPCTPDDAPACRDLHALLEKEGAVPGGYADEFAEWLEQPGIDHFVAEEDGRVIACCGWSDTAVKIDDEEIRMATLSFGLVHPDVRGRGWGSTQIAVRLLLARHAGIVISGVSATERSVEWLEGIGFFFWRTEVDLAKFYNGSLLLTETDAAFLTEWLGGSALQS